MSDLVFSKRTIDILNNFAAVNQSILFRKGNTLRSMAPTYQMFTKATIAENIPEEFAIFELNRFLNVLSTFSNYTIKLDLKNSRAIVSEGTRKAYIKFVAEDQIVVPKDGDIKLQNVFVNFDVTSGTVSNLQKMLGVLSLPEIAIVSKKGKLTIEVVNTDNITNDENTENFYSEAVGKAESDFRIVLKGDYINNLLKNIDYKVEIGKFEKNDKEVALINFKGGDVSYFISSEHTSEF